jgi:hypothetical protein
MGCVCVAAGVTDFSLRNHEHILLWELAQDKIISEYVRCFSERCQQLKAAKPAAASPASRGSGAE